MLDLSKPVRFRDEPDWKIINIVENPLGNKSCKLIVNAINRNGQVDCWFCKADGCFVSDDHESKLDVVNIKEKKIYRFFLIYWEDGNVSISNVDEVQFDIGQKYVVGGECIHIEKCEREIDI